MWAGSRVQHLPDCVRVSIGLFCDSAQIAKYEKETPECSSSWWLCFCSQSSEACLFGRKAESAEIILAERSAWFSSYCLFCFSSVAYRERDWRISSAHYNLKFPGSACAFVSNSK